MRLSPLLFALLPAVVLAQRSPFDGPRSTTLASPVVDVPLSKSGPFYFLDVKLNGQPFRFTLETGAGFFGISERAARALGVKTDSIEMGPGMRAAVARLDSVSMGGATFLDVSARVSPMWNNTDFDGIVSIPLLKQLLATIDLPASRLRLTRGELPPVNGRDVLAIAGRDQGGRIDIDIDFGGVRAPAVLDSRGMIGVVLPDTIERELRFADTLRSIGSAAGPSLGSFTLRGAHLASDIVVGDVRIPRAAVALRNRPGAVLGVPFMERFAIAIDQRNRRVQFTRPVGVVATAAPEQWETQGSIVPEAPADGPARRQAGPSPAGRPMGFNLAGAPGGELLVVNLLAGSNAEKAGVRNNDRLVELDGTPASSMSREVFQRTTAKTTPVKVIVMRDGQRLEFMITPQPGQ